MNIQWSRGRMKATLDILSPIRDTVNAELRRVAGESHDRYQDADTEWQTMVRELTEATADLLRAEAAMERVIEGLWRQHQAGRGGRE